MNWSYKKKVNLGVLVFLTWVLVQFFRATFGREPYPAIYLPGFSDNGSEPLESRELYVKKGDQYVLFNHEDAPFGHGRYAKLLRQFVKYYESGDDRLQQQVEGLIGFEKIDEGDSIRIDDIVWLPSGGEFVKSSTSRIRYKLTK